MCCSDAPIPRSALSVRSAPWSCTGNQTSGTSVLSRMLPQQAACCAALWVFLTTFWNFLMCPKPVLVTSMELDMLLPLVMSPQTALTSLVAGPVFFLCLRASFSLNFAVGVVIRSVAPMWPPFLN
eukprot:1155936-Pelagomonas_calceolata.AAC.4